MQNFSLLAWKISELYLSEILTSEAEVKAEAEVKTKPDITRGGLDLPPFKIWKMSELWLFEILTYEAKAEVKTEARYRKWRSRSTTMQNFDLLAWKMAEL